jgi:hypothetical protein
MSKRDDNYDYVPGINDDTGRSFATENLGPAVYQDQDEEALPYEDG